MSLHWRGAARYKCPYCLETPKFLKNKIIKLTCWLLWGFEDLFQDASILCADYGRSLRRKL